MSNQVKIENIYSGPIYDDYTLMQIEEQELEELITGLVVYCLSLEKQVISLRKQVNRLTPSGKVDYILIFIATFMRRFMNMLPIRNSSIY